MTLARLAPGFPTLAWVGVMVGSLVLAFSSPVQADSFDDALAELREEGRRGNADPEMVLQVKGLSEADSRAILDYVSRLEPPEEFQAPPGWRNPDFPE